MFCCVVVALVAARSLAPTDGSARAGASFGGRSQPVRVCKH
jgi:hypothetical protein